MLVVFRSYFTLLSACNSPEDLVLWAKSQGYGSLAIADRMNFYGLVRFVAACRRENLVPVGGMDISTDPQRPLLAFFGDRRGFSALTRLVAALDPKSSANSGENHGEAGPHAEAKPPANSTANHREAWSGAETDRGAVSTASINPGESIFSNLRVLMSEVLPGLNRLSAPGYPINIILPPSLSYGELREYRELIAGFLPRDGSLRFSVAALDGMPQRDALVLARKLGLECTAFVWGSWRNKREQTRNNLLRAIDLCVTVQKLPREELCPDSHRLSTLDEARSQFGVLTREVAAGEALAAGLDASFIIPGGYVFPDFEGLSEAGAFARLKQLCLEGLDRRYGSHSPPSPDALRRLEYELGIIRAKGFASYFLVVHNIVSRTPRTCGRGSSAASIVSYALGITHVDPIKHNLFFERFLNMGRKDPPDIDVDFPWDERAKTLEYVFERYAGRAAMVADHVTFGPRSSIREPAKAMGIDDEEISRFIRLWKLGQGDRLPGWLRTEAVAIRGIPRFIGTHPGGVVITPGPLWDYTHSQISPLGWPVIAWEKDAAEDAGLVKIDILGNRSLGVLRDCINAINSHYGTDLSWEGLDPLADEDTRRFIENGDTLGVFYVESPATRQLLQKMRRGDYPQLVIASSIIRPAANRYINEYVRRLHGASYVPIHPLVEEVLSETLGIMVYQEDVSRVAIAVSGFDAAEADALRKVLSRKDAGLSLDSWKERFFSGGRKNAVEAGVLEQLWNMVLSFSGYSFCKPHSASYALVSYKLAWIKRRYPLEFYTAVINNGGGYYSRQVYVNAARRLGHSVLLPDVNRGGGNYLIDYEVNALRSGLGQIKGMSAALSGRILEQRSRGGEFTSFSDFLRRIKPNMLQLRALIKSGALDSVEEKLNRPSMFWLTAALRKTTADTELFEHNSVEISDYTAGQKIRDEVETLGLFLTDHPMALFRSRALRFTRVHILSPLVDSREINMYINRDLYIGGFLVSGKEVYTSKREAMSFVSFEDEFGMFETVFFPQAYQDLAPQLDSSMVFIIHGTVREELGALSIHTINIWPLTRRYTGGTFFSDSFYTLGPGGGIGDRKAG